MSWFRRNSHSSEIFPGSTSPRLPVRKADPNACLEVFRNHWQQAWAIMERQSRQHPIALPTFDEVNIVINHIDQMITLLLGEKSSGSGTGPIFEYLLIENVLEKLFNWGIHSGEFSNQLKLEQLKFYEVLLINSQEDLLVHQPVLRPLLSLLTACGECSPLEVEKKLIILLNQLCVCIKQNNTLLDLFFNENNDKGPPKFFIFSLLIPFVHREGSLGQQARDALLLCMVLSQKNDKIGHFIAENSDFCPVLATGLSGLYSSLPRKLVNDTEEWFRLTRDDVNSIPELSAFLNSLEFCNAVIQLAHPLVQTQLLDYVYQGFLLPVLGPALHEEHRWNSHQEIVSAMMYLELFLQTITEPALMQTFLKFILLERHENVSILEIIVNRINTNSQQLCVAALSLIRSFLDLNCEDVMLELVFKYLIPCTHVMVSQRRSVKDVDLYSKTAQKFLSLIPNCCIPDPSDSPVSSRKSTLDGSESPLSNFKLGNFSKLKRSNSRSSISSLDSIRSNYKPRLEYFETSYNEYLADAHYGILSCAQACRCWSAVYDGEKPPPESVNNLSIINETKTKSESLLVGKPRSDTLSSIKSVNRFNSTDTFTHTPLVEMQVENLEIVSHGYGVEASGKNSCSHPNISSIANQVPMSHLCDPLHTLVVNASSVDNVHSDPIINSIPHSLCNNSHESAANSLKYQSDQIDPLSSKILAFDNNSSAYITLNSLSSENSSVHRLVNNVITTSQSNTAIPPNSPTEADFGNQNIGPLLSFLLNKLENMFRNSPLINMQLTGVISRLAYYPQPLIRSFLLNHNLVFQPSIRSLFQVLGTLKHKMDCLSYTIDDFEELMIRARQCMLTKEEQSLLQRGPNMSGDAKPRSETTPEISLKDKRRSLTNFLFRRGSFSGERSFNRKYDNKQNTLQSIPGNLGYRYINRLSLESANGKPESIRLRNIVYCAIILEEFLKELAAISQEHSVLQIDEGYFEF